MTIELQVDIFLRHAGIRIVGLTSNSMIYIDKQESISANGGPRLRRQTSIMPQECPW